QELLETGGPIHGKIGVKRGDGGVILLDGYGVVINDRDGNKVCIYTFEDVTVEEANKEMLISKNKELTISEKRYEIAMRNSSDIVFDYLVDTKEIICDHCVNKKLGLMEHVNESVETIISLGGVHPNSVQTFRELFNKIDHGETTAKATIVLYGVSGEETINDILLTNVFDEYGNPIRAIGVITDISGTVTLETERRYREAMMYGKVLAYEANVTRDIITSIDDEWSKTLGISRRVSFSNMIEYLAEHVVHPDFIDEFKRFSSYETIEAAFCSGKVKETFEYLRKDPNGVYVWVGNKMNIIKDGITDDIRVRCYVNEINEQKKKELRVLEEQRFYDTMISKAVTVYAVNITMNLVLGGHEEWEERFTVAPTSSYSQMIQRYTEKSIHPDDREKFKQCYLRANVMNAYEQGKREIFCEYRRLEALKEYKWVSCSLHLFEDPDTADIKAFSYVQNIDGEKKRELELLYKAEHDSLTGYYNKSAIEQKVNEFLLTRNGELKNHAFLIFDIDYFKAVNDNFGHAWGDTILMKIAKKVRNLFREEDILGRIGGDEFVILMKNITSEQAVFEKARELCNTTKVAFVHEGEEFKISTSVGIAISNIHGKTYGTLYKKSDIALYVSKNNGRDQFAIYDKSMNEKTTPMIDIIDIEQS
ncbi:MAG: sensor domain-containing diguanylate cyclase, partial [Longicatena sp.]